MHRDRASEWREYAKVAILGFVIGGGLLSLAPPRDFIIPLVVVAAGVSWHQKPGARPELQALLLSTGGLLWVARWPATGQRATATALLAGCATAVGLFGRISIAADNPGERALMTGAAGLLAALTTAVAGWWWIHGLP